MLPAELNSYGSRSDGSMRLSFSTGIINNEQLLIINALKNSTGILLYKDTNITKEEETIIDSIQDPIKRNYTPSQKLRFAIENLRIRENKFHPQEYYEEKMNQIIEWINNK